MMTKGSVKNALKIDDVICELSLIVKHRPLKAINELNILAETKIQVALFITEKMSILYQKY